MGQTTVECEVAISPEPHFQKNGKDYFGNEKKYFSIQSSHESLEVVSSVIVDKDIPNGSKPDSGEVWDRPKIKGFHSRVDNTNIPLGNYLLPSAACPGVSEIDLFLQPTLRPGREIMEVVSELMARIYTEFDYVPGATDTSTPLHTVLKKKTGVCQDFAHVMIAALRRINIPARYVSGYLETIPPVGQVKLQGADATHAWIEVYTESTGWVGFDPTNNIIPAEQHIKIAHGRDYFDVQPLKGTFIGSGSQSLVVEVDVQRI